MNGSKVRVQFEQSMSQLQSKLQDSIEQEDYEEAARIRDQLKDLEKKAKAKV